MLNVIKMRYPSKISKLYLLKLSIPIFFSNLATPFVGIVDTGLMGHLNNVKFLAASSIATSVITMVFWSFGFLRMGTTGLIAQLLGRGDYREIVLTTIRYLTLAFFIGFIILFLKLPIMMGIKYFFVTSEETYLLINKYISVRLFSAPAELCIYVLAGLYIGLQKTKISSVMIAFFALLNIFLSVYFVKYLNLNIYGVALGTVVSSYITVIIFLIFSYFYIHKTFNIIPRFRNVFLPKKFFKMFGINFDIFVRTFLLTFAFLWFTYQSSIVGEDFLAVNTILIQFIIISSFFLDAYAFSTEGVVGFSLGRKIKKSFLHAVSNSFKLSIYTGLIISIIYFFSFKYLINYLTDIDYLRFLSYSFIVWVLIIPPIASICYQYDGIFIGTSQTKDMRNSMILSVLIFILLSIFLTKTFNNHGLWLSLLIFMIVRSLTLKFCFSNILKKF